MELLSSRLLRDGHLGSGRDRGSGAPPGQRVMARVRVTVRVGVRVRVRVRVGVRVVGNAVPPLGCCVRVRVKIKVKVKVKVSVS